MKADVGAIQRAMGLAGEVTVVADLDPELVFPEGVGIFDCYVESFWLAIVGPSCCWALRRLATAAAMAPDGVTLALDNLARALGLGGGTSANSPVVRTLARLAAFGLVTYDIDTATVSVPDRIPHLTSRQMERCAQAWVA